MTSNASNRDQAVQDQYETLPYPARDPKDEDKRLLVGSPSYLAEVEHYLFAGRLPQDGSLRILVAGGGTGDALMMLAQHCANRHIPAAITYLDQSTAARAIAEARLARRGLTAHFVTASLLDLPSLGLGEFDYIDCCGVLHHLEDPAAGLAALVSVLSPRGGIGMMLYGALGRRGVYDLQTILAAIASSGPPPDRIATSRKLLKELPPTNALRASPWIRDHIDGRDAGLFDLLLHARDRAYTVDQVLDLVAGAGLRVASFIEPLRYAPETYVTDAKLRRAFADLDPRSRLICAERLAGNMSRHITYLTRADAPPTITPCDYDRVIPVLRDMDGPTLATQIGTSTVLEGEFDLLPVRLPLPRLAGPILKLVDGQRCLADIRRDILSLRRDLDETGFNRAFDDLLTILGGLNRLLLRLPPS